MGVRRLRFWLGMGVRLGRGEKEKEKKHCCMVSDWERSIRGYSSWNKQTKHVHQEFPINAHEFRYFVCLRLVSGLRCAAFVVICLSYMDSSRQLLSLCDDMMVESDWG